MGEFLDRLKRMTPHEAASLFRQRPELAEFLDRQLPREGQKLFVSEHDDEVLRVEHGYGKGRERPEDYLESFGRFIAESLNEIPALVVVTQRPRDLTRQEGYGELQLRTAWREWKNEDIAASIIGFIRQRALGEPLKPYAERVDAALRRVLASREWTKAQRDWLERIGKQMRLEEIVDREALDRGQFRARGGFDRMNRVFDGRLDDVLGDLHEEVWKESA